MFESSSNFRRLKLLVGTFLLLASPTAFCATQTGAPTVKQLLGEPTALPTSTQEIPRAAQDKYNRTTPRASYSGLQAALDDRDHRLALEYIDLRKLPKSLTGKSQDLTRELKIIFDRSLPIDIDTLSDSPAGYKNDSLPKRQDLLVSLETPDGNVDILMQYVPHEKGSRVWKLSSRSVAKISALYQHYGYGELGDKLARYFPAYAFMGLEVWQWVMMLGIVAVAFVAAWLITRIIAFVLLARKADTSAYLHKFIAGPVRFLILIIIGRVLFDSIAPSALAQTIFEAGTLLIIAIAWLFMGLIELGFGHLGARMKHSGNGQAIVLLRPTMSLVKIVVLFLALMSWLDNLGFSVTTLLAGLGVGGIAVGLAAQKSIENLIGAITMYVAQPVKLGDFCRAGNTLGIVEEIGLRSTMIRTLDRTVVNIPNATFANLDIENLTKRDRILYRRTIKLRSDTKPDQIRTVLQKVRQMFDQNEAVNPEPARIRFLEFGEYSLNLEIFAYIETIDFNEYLGIVESINLNIMDIIEEAGSSLAAPVSVIQTENRT